VFTFSASAVDPDPGESVASFSWSFDDGSVASGPQVTHAFATAGAHSATVTVADTAGVTAKATVNVTVLDRTPPTRGGPRTAASIVSGRALPRLGRRYTRIVRFTLSEDARVGVRFERRVRGTWRLVPGAFAVAGKKGTNGLRFAGRLSTRIKLRPGIYRIRMRATDAAGNRSRFARARFTLVAAP
jgi:PKD repeat protein